MPSDFALQTMNRVHRVILAVTGGRVGWKAGGMEAVQLHTIGRVSGQRRSVMLTCPVRAEGGLVIVASKGGEPEHPSAQGYGPGGSRCARFGR